MPAKETKTTYFLEPKKFKPTSFRWTHPQGLRSGSYAWLNRGPRSLEAELSDLTLDYKAALAVDSKRHDAEARLTARLLGYEGVNTFHIGEYESAAALFELAWSKLRTPSLALWSARALAQSGRSEEAAARYAAAAELSTDEGDPDVERRAQASAAAELDQLQTAPRPP
jgi:Flp pilus assembly protein TadD